MPDLSTILTPEEILLLRLCRLEFTPEQKTEINNLAREVTRWSEFVRLSNEHGIIALCHYNLSELGLISVLPAGQAEIMKKSYLASVARNTRIFSLLDQVAAIAKEEGIDIVLIKGLALEKTIYGNRGLRQMNDLDILVKSGDAIKLRKALLKNGFESIPMVSPLHEKILPSYGKHLPEMYKDGLSVEIHFKLFDQKGNSLTKQFIENSMPLSESADSNTIHPECGTRNPERETRNAKLHTPYPIPYTPYPLHHFIYLVKHLAKHESGGVSQLRLYTDLLLLLPLVKNQLANKEAAEFVSVAGMSGSLAEKLFLLERFRDVELRIPRLPVLNEGEKSEAYTKFIHFLRHPKDMRSDEKPDSFLKPLREMEGPWSKVLFITGYLFPSLKFMKYRYKISSGFTAILYYPVRWFKLLSLIFTRSL